MNWFSVDICRLYPLLPEFFNLTKFTFTAVLQIYGIYLFFQGTAINGKS